jgi:hypothetical protein
MAEESKYHRRQLFGTTALSIAAAQFGILFKHGKEVRAYCEGHWQRLDWAIDRKHARLEAPKHNVA